MEAFLLRMKSLLNNLTSLENFRVVLGNEACDLDSAVSALSYAYFLNNKCDLPAFPVLNIPEKDISLKTEVVFLLKQNNISLNNLIFKDSFDMLSLKNSAFEITLVDHHLLSEPWASFNQNVTEILDHRPKDSGWNWSNKVLDKIQMVGSCATLVANEIFKSNSMSDEDLPIISNLLHATILLDTVNFSKSADRARELDIKMVEKLEKILNVSEENLLQYRLKIFNDLNRAKADISGLTPEQILFKDMKKIGAIPVSGMPILIERYLQIPGATKAITDMCQINSTKVVILMGMQINESVVIRDFGIYSKNCDKEINELLSVLKNNKQPDLILREKKSNMSGLKLFSQGNIKATRKHIYPILKNALEKLNLCNAIN